MIKLIMSDMDGTLLDGEGKIPAEFAEIAELLQKHQVQFAPASGRQYYALLKQFPEYEDRFVFIADNGTDMRYQGRELYASVIKDETARGILAAVENLSGIYPVFCGKKSAYVTTDYQPFLVELEKYYTQYKLVKSFAEVEDEPIKISFFFAGSEAGAAAQIEPVMKPFAAEVQVVLSKKFIDVTNKGINKGTAVKELQRILKVKPEECAAFGDYLNDVGMMEAVYYSYAMKNAHPELKKVTRFVTEKTNLEHGELATIREFAAKGLLG